MSVAGSIHDISLEGRNFSVAAGCDAELNLGGYENSTIRFGDGTTGITMARKAWSLRGVEISINDMRDDEEYLASIRNNGVFVNVAVTMASGAVYVGLGTIVGPVDRSTAAGTASIDLEGDGALTRDNGTWTLRR